MLPFDERLAQHIGESSVKYSLEDRLGQHHENKLFGLLYEKINLCRVVITGMVRRDG